jgi:hypothetical protein
MIFEACCKVLEQRKGNMKREKEKKSSWHTRRSKNMKNCFNATISGLNQIKIGPSEEEASPYEDGIILLDIT